MRWLCVAIAVSPLALASAPAIAGPLAIAPLRADASGALDVQWPAVPPSAAPSLEDQLTDRLTALGNAIGRHLDLLSHDTVTLRVDCRQRRAHLRIGGGDPARLALSLEGDIEMHDLDAQIAARLTLNLRGRTFAVQLPRFDMAPTSARGYGVEFRLPLIARTF